jgi:hypothetical protein
LILDDTSPEAVVVDPALPPSTEKVHEALARVWPRLRGRTTFIGKPLDDVAIDASDVVVASHACGELTDAVIDRAAAARARLARAWPCCPAATMRQPAIQGI